MCVAAPLELTAYLRKTVVALARSCQQPNGVLLYYVLVDSNICD